MAPDRGIGATTSAHALGHSRCAHPREILRPVIVGAAYAFAMMHNHLSGCTDSSDADWRMTHCVREASEIIGINLMGHVIVGVRPGMNQTFFGFRAVGLI